MGRRKRAPRLDRVPEIVPDRLAAPLGVILGGSRDVADFAAACQGRRVICYQMDLFQAEQLRRDLDQRGAAAEIVTAADLWDVPEPLAALVYPVLQEGERALKLDLVEQAYHALQPGGTLTLLTPTANDPLFLPLLKKVFGNLHVPPLGDGHVLWAQRKDDRPRRRHEIRFHVQQPEGPSLEFVSRPGVFAHGRFDHGARALVETMTVEPGDRVLDVGCGCGINGIQAGLRAGPEGEVVFVDSNVRALAVTELNARANGLPHFRTAASATVDPGGGPFDLALANPPYFGQQSIAALFIRRCRELLRPGGRFYLVSKQSEAMAGLIAESFDEAEAVVQRGYTVFSATAK